MNAFELFEEAIENAAINDDTTGIINAEFFNEYALNALGISLCDETAKRMEDAYNAWELVEDRCSKTYAQTVRQSLEGIEL